MGWLRALAFALILAAGLVAVDEVAASSTAPKPDPPPVRKKAPPPPPRPAPPPPPVYQAPPPPPPPIVSEPPASGPSAAQIAAARRAAEAKAKAAKREARLKKLKKQRRQARRAARIAAAKRAAKNRERDAALGEDFGGQSASEGTGSSGFLANESRKALPFVVVAAVAALIILGLGLVPAYVVPWYRMSMVLEDHRQQFTFVGGMALLGAGIFLALTFLSG